MRRRAISVVLTIVAAWALATVPAQAGILRAESILPPGQSGFVGVTGLLSGSGSPHLYDQQQPFINFQRKDAMLDQPGSESDPRPGVKIVRDGFGVPSVSGDTVADAWWGAGYAIAQDRLAQLEIFRRATTGHLSEVLGAGYLPMDIATRRDFYTSAELAQMMARLPADMQQRYASYLGGVNAWVDHVLLSPADLPGEFAALGLPTQFSLTDLAAIGVFLARTTPNGDGSELANAHALDASGASAFNTILPLRVAGQISTVPRANGVFPSVPGRTPAQERAALRRSAPYVSSLPLPTAADLGTESPTTTASAAGTSARARLVSPIHVGGSSMVAIGDRVHHHAVLFSGPELGFSAPEELVELEVHAPGLDVRGVTAAGAPVIAIGHNRHVAWGLTSGLTQTNSLYAEKLVPGHPEEYQFNGGVRQMDCRNETFSYRPAVTSLLNPAGLLKSPPQSGSQTLRLCRTVHGPVQARAGGYAYARRYATWMRETDTITGLAAVDTAASVADVDRATALLTWNENIMAADDGGHIGYWHPGLLPVMPTAWDERLPFPGSGEAEWQGLLRVAERPHVIDPKQRWLANWNNIPSQGWTTGNDPASERVAGGFFRVGWLDRLVRGIVSSPTLNALEAVIHTAGTTAQQRPLAEPQLRRALRGASAPAATVLQTILAWDGSYSRVDAHGTTDPGASAWQELKGQAQRLAIAPLGEAGKIIAAGVPNPEHVFDVSLGQAYALRTLSPAGYRAAAAAAFSALSSRYHSSEPSAWRAPRVMVNQSAQGAEQPPPMPFFDRGTWEQFVELGQ
ncbi:MAG: penicillin acylase family protein [Solirubrobacteraceae bacterium]